MVKEVPKIHMEYRERIVEVPQVQYVDKFVEVPQVQVQEVVRPGGASLTPVLQPISCKTHGFSCVFLIFWGEKMA